MTAQIAALTGRRIWDSRGRPTVEAEIVLACGARGRGVAPSGASRGRFEVCELRDGGDRLGGFGVEAALSNLNGPVADGLLGWDADDQARLDARLVELDGTHQRTSLGGNVLVAVSAAALAATAAMRREPMWRVLSEGRPVRLPLPEVQIFGGGAHAGRRVDVQDFLVMPVGATSFDQAMEMCAEVYRAAGDLMEQHGLRRGVADEGGWWPDFASNEAALDMLARAIDRAGYGGGEVMISLDVAASELEHAGGYRLGLEGRVLDADGWFGLLTDWVGRYPILSIEDPAAQDDMEGMRRFTAAVGDRVQVVGDDFLVTNAARVSAAAVAGAANAVLIKPNQVGTLTEARQALDVARGAGWGTIVSARSGETEDVLIAHLAVGWDAGQIKVGSMARSERTAKWNELLRIEAESGAPFAGRAGLPRSLA